MGFGFVRHDRRPEDRPGPLAPDAARNARPAGCDRLRGQAPAVRSDRPPAGFDAREPAETRNELTIGQRWRRLADDRSGVPSMLVARGDLTGQALMDGARPDDQQLVVRGQSTGDLREEPLQVLESVRFTGRLRAAPATIGA